MTEPYQPEKLPAYPDCPAPLDSHHTPTPLDPHHAPVPGVTEFGVPVPRPPVQPHADPRYLHPVPPAAGYVRPVYPTQQMYHAVPQHVPVVNVTQNNMGGGFVAMRRGPSHGLHLLLTIISCGLWAPVWILVVVLDAMNRK
ncbi:hypothetical protein [Nocardia sp. NPDC004415]